MGVSTGRGRDGVPFQAGMLSSSRQWAQSFCQGLLPSLKGSFSLQPPFICSANLWHHLIQLADLSLAAAWRQEESFWLEFSRRKGCGQQHCSLAQRTAMRHQAAHEVGYSDPYPLGEKDACVLKGRGRRDKGFCCSNCKYGGDEN